MYICIDVGGTKTIIARLNDDGVITEQTKIPTPHNYQDFLDEVAETIGKFSENKFVAGTIGVPGIINRARETANKLPNLPWQNVNIADDIKNIVSCPIFIENDAKLAGLSETMLVKDQFSKVLYITISTGIGFSVIDNLKIDTSAGDLGGHLMLVEIDGKLVSWESIASGRALSEQYGKMARDIDNSEIWEKFSKDLAVGVIELTSIFLPQVIIFGGGVGNYFGKFADFLKKDLEEYHLPLIDMPVLKGAERADEAVLYGGYDYAKQKLNNE